MLSISVRQPTAEIEIRVPKMIAPTKDLWLLEASRLIWEIWTKLGWQTSSERTIKPDDWKKPIHGEAKDNIMAMVERLLKVIDIAFPETGEEFEAIIDSISKISDDIHEGDFKLEDCVEVEEFRKMVLRILFLGTIRGLNTNSADGMGYLRDPINKRFYYDKDLVREEEDFVFHKAKESYVSTYTVHTSLTIPFCSVHLDSCIGHCDDFSA